MKKLLFLCGCLILLGGNASASNCQEVTFDDATVCISVDKKTNNEFQLNVDVSNGDGDISLECVAWLPNDEMTNVGACDGEFTYNGGGEGIFKLLVRVNNQQKRLETIYNFDNGEGGNSLNINNKGSRLNSISITTDSSSPIIGQRVDLIVKANDSANNNINEYNGSINYKVYYKCAGSSFWTQTTSSNYYEISTDYVDGYAFTPSDDGIANLSNFITFKTNNCEYKIRVYDNTKNTLYEEITFAVGSPISNNEDAPSQDIDDTNSNNLSTQSGVNQNTITNSLGLTGLADAISWLFTNGLSIYNNLNSFRPNDSITREQASKFFALFNALINDTSTVKNPNCVFKDINNADSTLVTYISQACGQGIIKGSKGNFNPFGKLTKAQAITILVRIMIGSLDESGNLWYSNYFYYAQSLSLLDGMGYDMNIADNEYITRGDMAILIYRAYNILHKN